MRVLTSTYVLITTTCYITPLLHALRSTGSECKEDNECVANAYCYEGKKCFCKDRYIAINTSKNTFICVNEASYIGEECQYDIQCSSAFGTHAECIKRAGQNENASGKCDCMNDSHYQDGICYKNSRIGEECKVSDNCVIRSMNITAYCDHSRCICPPYYHPNNDGTDCLPSSNLGGPCLHDEDCITMNSRCSGVCTCQMGYLINEAKTHCLIAADKLYAPCDEDSQCSQFLQRAICDPMSNRCNCSYDSHELNGACYKTSHLHEPCKKKEECLINSRNLTRLDCYNGFCMCKDNYETISRVDCIEKRETRADSSGTALSVENTILFTLLIVSVLAVPIL